MAPTRVSTLQNKRKNENDVPAVGFKKQKLSTKPLRPLGDATNANEKRPSRLRRSKTEDTIVKKQPLVKTNRTTVLRQRSKAIVVNRDSTSPSCASTGKKTAEKTAPHPPTPESHKPRNRAPPPEGVKDFDEQYDYFGASEMVKDIFDHFEQRQYQFICPCYIDTQTNLTKTIRAMLVDWMVEVQESFELTHESLYLGVKLVDLYLSKKSVNRNNLQLVGAACMFIAAKYEERVISTPVLDDVKYLCEDTYSHEQIKIMEQDVFRTVGFDLGMPTSYTFLRRMARTNASSNQELTLARYILEMSLMDYDLSVKCIESHKAGGALFLARTLLKEQQPWTPSLQWHSGLAKDLVTPYVSRLHSVLLNPLKSLKVVRNKYSHEVFLKVAAIPVPSKLEV